MKCWEKWSYLIILLICGIGVLTVTDSWEAAGKPAKEALGGIREVMALVIGRVEEAGDTEGSLSEEADGKHQTEGEQQGGIPDREEPGQEGVQEQEGAQEEMAGQDGTPVGGNGDDPDADREDSGEPAYRDPSEVVYTTVEDDYFDDAVFIGDSRTVGLFEYGGLENTSTFYASTGLTIYKLFDSPVVSVPDQKDKITIEQALGERQFAKIYLMVGINEMGRGTLEEFLQKYSEAIQHLKELQPDAVIYIQAIMKVTTKRSGQGDYINNEGIDARNAGIAALADNIRVYYLDVNPVICDETGGMEPSYTTDGVHLKAQYIPMWKDFLKQHAVVLD